MRQLDFEALGTTCHLFGVDLASDPLEWGAGWVIAMHARFTRFDASSELSRFNAAAGRWVAVSPELEAMLRAALDAHRATGGLVHAGVLPAVLATGYTRPLRQGPTAATAGPPPPAPLSDLLEVAAGRARLRAGAGVDTGGIAKGGGGDRLANESLCTKKRSCCTCRCSASKSGPRSSAPTRPSARWWPERRVRRLRRSWPCTGAWSCVIRSQSSPRPRRTDSQIRLPANPRRPSTGSVLSGAHT